MSEKPDFSRSDLTTTIHLSSLKALSPHLASIVENLTDEDREVLAQLPLGSGMFIVATGPAKGSRFLVDKTTTTIGRQIDSDIFLDDVTVSRKHAVVESSNSSETSQSRTFTLKDLGSLNGTYVDGLPREVCELSNGNEIHIGKFKLIFFANDGQNLNFNNLRK
jgi:pSer/pThr/pTyr-binding forkhead associated (FHA) protein